MIGFRSRKPSAKDYESAVGRRATTEEVATKLGVSVNEAERNLHTMKRLGLISFSEPNIWHRAALTGGEGNGI